MGRHWRGLGSIALVAMSAGLLGGCGLLRGTTFEDDTVLTDEITSVQLDGDNDSFTLRGDQNTTEVSIHRRVTHRGGQPDDPSYRVDDGVLMLSSCGRNCSVDYTIELPAGLPVSGETDNGEISLSEVGEVDVRSDNGEVTVDSATDLVAVRTNNGDIDITLDTPQDVRAEADNGAITVTVPEGSYQVSTQTDNGRTEIGIPDDPAGTHSLELTTDNGAITLRSA